MMDLMMAWAKTKMAHPQLVKEVYSLLYRQYNGAREVGTWEGHLQWVGHVWGCEGGGAYREHVLQASACAHTYLPLNLLGAPLAQDHHRWTSKKSRTVSMYCDCAIQ